MQVSVPFIPVKRVEQPKKLSKVNQFKAPSDWYESVKALCEERGTSIGQTIIWLVNISLPIGRQVMENERKAIREAQLNELSPHGKKEHLASSSTEPTRRVK